MNLRPVGTRFVTTHEYRAGNDLSVSEITWEVIAHVPVRRHKREIMTEELRAVSISVKRKAEL